MIGNITGLVWGDAGAARGSSTTVEDSVGGGRSGGWNLCRIAAGGQSYHGQDEDTLDGIQIMNQDILYLWLLGETPPLRTPFSILIF